LGAVAGDGLKKNTIKQHLLIGEDLLIGEKKKTIKQYLMR
jgi:hypothetical protein